MSKERNYYNYDNKSDFNNNEPDYYIGEGVDIEKSEEIMVKNKPTINKRYVKEAKLKVEHKIYEKQSGIFDIDEDLVNDVNNISIDQKPKPIIRNNSNTVTQSLEKTNSRKSEDEGCGLS